MPRSPRLSGQGWILHRNARLGCAGTLVHPFGSDVVCRFRMTPALTSLMLALAACREIDERDGVTEMVGCCSLAELGLLVSAMPGPGNVVSGPTIGGYKRDIVRRAKRALQALSLEVGRPLRASDPILQPGYGEGYALPPEGLRLIGVSIDDLVVAVRELRARASHGFPPR